MAAASVFLREENRPVAFLLAILGMSAFTPIFAAGKLADGLLPIVILVWLRFLGGAVTISTVAVVKRVNLFTGLSPLWKLHVLRAMCAVSGLGCAIYAASVLPLVDAMAIGLTSGIFAIALAGLILKEAVTVRHWIAGFLCASGAYLVVQSTGATGGQGEVALAGAIAALLGALIMACETLIIRYISQREDTVTILSYVNILASILLAGPAIWLIARHEITAMDLLSFAWMGPLAIVGQSMNISAFRRAGAATLAPVFYGKVILSGLFGFAVWGEVPSLTAGFGAFVIIVGGAILTINRPIRFGYILRRPKLP